MIALHPIELFRYCPKCGTSHLAVEGGKQIVCGQCGFRYFINASASVACVIRNDSDQVLFTVRRHEPSAGMLDLPGGFADQGETAEQAVVREISEELNLQVTGMKFLRTFTNEYAYSGVIYHTLDLLYECTVHNFDALKADDDVSSFEFRNIESVHIDEIGLDSVKQMLSFLKNRS